MKAAELHQKSVEELKAELTALLKAQFSLRMQHATGQLAKPSELNRVRKDIARVHTIMAQKAA
ncbi:MAG: 50S ribosomal protein L29 [Iodobacter sp.]|jgi:large subunit ribosomal protein L29|uniref:Large ribosomal subunit protein uL29 n=5 Tax=Iodobacter TaxID=32014 RepID=A0A3S8ZUB4_9NEIS|nr:MULTISPECIES: 50S ribosomal protein L29 [Betaproteobacteria]MBY0447026.1 50S ribosomal protein L29 [Burkholderiales bacterium]MCX7205221.1 50S ribosomal protein L29 [Pseudomonadota bacterium]AMC35907.1 50S ribosomal protein L29 [Janthinobacterium sp. B9-8]AZN37031.1 50S ribosomal protein L29 [Iodobacter ciconiae]MDW5415104.1 50S ribosomal protein L29 [Iodobacter sp. CM08]